MCAQLTGLPDNLIQQLGTDALPLAVGSGSEFPEAGNTIFLKKRNYRHQIVIAKSAEMPPISIIIQDNIFKRFVGPQYFMT